MWNADDRDIPILNQADDHNFENDTIFHAFCLLRRLAMDVHPSEIEYITSEIENGTRYHSKAIRALKWLGERPWWRRIWTVQECILPTQCVVVYGPVQAPWSIFYDAMSNLQRHRISCCASVPGISDTLSGLSVIMTHLRDIRTWRQEGRGISLSTLMKIFRYRQATQKRDKVYGLLGLVTNWGTAGPSSMDPDYHTSTHQQIFIRTTAAIIQSTRSLDILCQYGNIGINDFGILPSWVIDYSMPVSELGTAHDIHVYTSGRWLIHEELERNSRYISVSFDVLCKRILELCPGAVSIVSYEKREGSFNKVFIFTTDNGKRIVARLPTRISGPPEAFDQLRSGHHHLL